MKAFLLGMGVIAASTLGMTAEANLVVDCAEGYTFVEGKGCIQEKELKDESSSVDHKDIGDAKDDVEAKTFDEDHKSLGDD